MANPLEIFAGLADPTRLRILALVRAMELSVGELAQVLGQSQPRVSRHVKILSDAGLVERRKEGSWVFVALGLRSLVDPVFAALDTWRSDGAESADAARLAAVRADRAASAASWFESHAREWDAIRSLHVAEDQVEVAIDRLVGTAPVGRMIDVGTGTGRMLELFAGRADHALGIDRSSQMLGLARAKLANGPVADLRQADFYALPLRDAAVDLAILHHVLHFAQQPGAAITESARVLGAGGRLLIADFASHDREDLRARGAHAWLGFSDEQVDAWFRAAGLMTTATEMLDGGELTVKLWLGAKPGVRLREVKAA